MSYPTLKNEDPTLFKIKTKDDEIEVIKYRTEKLDYENILKSLKTDNDYYRKKNKNLNKKKVLLVNSENLIRSSSTRISSTLSILFPILGIPIASSSALILSIATFITNEDISKLKIRYTKIRDWINVISLLYQKTSKQSMIDKNNR